MEEGSGWTEEEGGGGLGVDIEGLETGHPVLRSHYIISYFVTDIVMVWSMHNFSIFSGSL